MRSILRLLICSMVASIAASLISPSSVQAQASQSVCPDSSATIYHAPSSESPAYMEIACPFAGNSTDRVLVYDRNGNMRDTGDWRTATDFINDLWIFDAEGDGKANLIIDFHNNADILTADIYDDQTGDSIVDFQITNGQVVVTESPYSTIKVTARDGWWQRDGKVNFNLDLAVDGMVVAMPITVAKVYQEITRHDGTPDQLIMVRDPNNRGWPDTDIRRAPAAESYSVVNAAIMKDYGTKHVPIQDAIFFPLLGTAYIVPDLFDGTDIAGLQDRRLPRPFGRVRSWDSFPAPIQVFWDKSRIIFVGEFTASHISNSRFIYSINPLKINQLNQLNFENPFDFYDLANYGDGYADLQVRLETYDAHDTTFNWGNFDQPATIVRYSWDVEHDHNWDFKLGLTGRNAVNSEVEYGGFRLKSLPHAEAPFWVNKQIWDAGVFVQIDNSYNSSEGIYTWDTLALRDTYITGLATEPDISEFSKIDAHARGEYTTDLQSQPYLYFSPIDRKLHLLKAQAGLWNIDGMREIRSRNLGGEYINEWVYREAGKELRSLHAANGYLIYADTNRVELVRANVPSALFTTLPPRNHDEWVQFGQRMNQYANTIAPGDFAAMIAQFSGATINLEGASLRDFRLLDNGFRFVLDLRSGYQGSGDLGLPGNLQPGAYVISYNGTFQAQPLTPPVIGSTTNVANLTQLERGLVSLELNNSGGEDLPPATLELWATPQQGTGTLVTTRTVTLLSDLPISEAVEWAPRRSGNWILQPRLVLGNGQILQLPSSSVVVQPSATLEPSQLLVASNGSAALIFIPFALLMFGGLAGLMIAQQRRDERGES